MTTSKPPADVISALILVLREHGLIVLALGALVWQVYFLANLAREQQDAWRSTLKEVAVEMASDRRQRSEAAVSFMALLSSMQETARTTQTLLAAVEEACEIHLKPASPDP